MNNYDREHYTPRTLCEVCAKACGGCSWSRKGVQQPVEGWDAIRHDLQYEDNSYCGARKDFYNESYIVLRCPEFELEPRNAWAFKKFDPERIHATLASRSRGFKRDKITGRKLIQIDEGTAEEIPND